MKLTRKEVKSLKRTLTTGILNQMNSETGYEVSLGTPDNRYQETVCASTEYVDSTWGAGIDSGASYKFGDTLTQVEFASEEAKRMLRDMFPAQANFITWAWYN